MITVRIENARVGMKIVRPVMNDSGMVLVQEGTDLTDRVIERLRHWGATVLYVKGEEETISSEDMQKKRKEIVDRFQDVSDNRLMAAIRDIVLKQLDAGRKESGGAEEAR